MYLPLDVAGSITVFRISMFIARIFTVRVTSYVSERALNVLSLPSATKLRRLCFYTCLSVILFTGRGVCLSACWDTNPPEQAPPEPGTLPPDQTPPPAADSYCCGRYASYWNAFLFTSILRIKISLITKNIERDLRLFILG